MGQKSRLHSQYIAGMVDAIAMLDQGEAAIETVREELMAMEAEEAVIADLTARAETIRVEKAEIQRFLDLAQKLGRKPTAEELKAPPAVEKSAAPVEDA